MVWAIPGCRHLSDQGSQGDPDAIGSARNRACISLGSDPTRKGARSRPFDCKDAPSQRDGAKDRHLTPEPWLYNGYSPSHRLGAGAIMATQQGLHLSWVACPRAEIPIPNGHQGSNRARVYAPMNKGLSPWSQRNTEHSARCCGRSTSIHPRCLTPLLALLCLPHPC